MYKLLFLVLMVIGAGWLLKGNVGVTADKAARSAGATIPKPGFGQALGQSDTQSRNLAKGADLRNIPPELLKFITPSLLTTTPTGTKDLSPAARLALRQIMTQARANPAAFKEQLGVVARSLRGQQ